MPASRRLERGRADELNAETDVGEACPLVNGCLPKSRFTAAPRHARSSRTSRPRRISAQEISGASPVSRRIIEGGRSSPAQRRSFGSGPVGALSDASPAVAGELMDSSRFDPRHGASGCRSATRRFAHSASRGAGGAWRWISMRAWQGGGRGRSRSAKSFPTEVATVILARLAREIHAPVSSVSCSCYSARVAEGGLSQRARHQGPKRRLTVLTRSTARGAD